VLSRVRVKVERRRIRHVTASVVRHDRKVIAYFLLHRPAFVGIKRIADGNVRCPGDPAIGAVRVEQLRVDVVCGVSRIQPYRINPSVRSDGKRAKPMPLVLIHRVVVDPLRRAKG